ncbi:ArsC/Spx/MgsR family protein [Nocardioides sp. R-C-SC26]|uniref:ArsC/Spx/MgsR family protein n=1 Tax=Nocardioides sp. R-C-SC26 TaxID=2870414 RepID=UPI001E63F10A|nr:ArsC/Spx/MgsR family protein [Nocardioides sp. R-C-SC26]
MTTDATEAWEIWHNPSCSKSRAALSALRAAGHDVVVRAYLDHPPTAEELTEMLRRLGLEPWEVARSREAHEAGIDLPREVGARAAWIEALAAHPRAIQRPIVTTPDGGALVVRDTETLDRITG